MVQLLDFVGTFYLRIGVLNKLLKKKKMLLFIVGSKPKRTFKTDNLRRFAFAKFKI